uniref:Uncharacterized protein n=1 Tax=Arundo donax TaxID=35708 RepID=A0A0A9A3P4_ARUDO
MNCAACRHWCVDPYMICASIYKQVVLKCCQNSIKFY